MFQNKFEKNKANGCFYGQNFDRSQGFMVKTN